MKNSFLINQTDVTYVIQIDQVLYCIADRGYSFIHVMNGEIIANTRTLANLSKHLNENFVRISQSIIVNKHHVCKIFKKNKCIELINGKQLSYTVKTVDLIDLLSNRSIKDEEFEMKEREVAW